MDANRRVIEKQRGRRQPQRNRRRPECSEKWRGDSRPPGIVDARGKPRQFRV